MVSAAKIMKIFISIIRIVLETESITLLWKKTQIFIILATDNTDTICSCNDCMKFKRVNLSGRKYSHGKISHGEKSEERLKRWYLSHGDLSDLYLPLSYQIKVWEQQPRLTLSTKRCKQRFKTDPLERPRLSLLLWSVPSSSWSSSPLLSSIVVMVAAVLETYQREFTDNSYVWLLYH